MQVGSAGHERQFVALPATRGFREFLKYDRWPVDAMVFGRCGAAVLVVGCGDGGGEQSSHMMKSISWQDFVSKEPTPSGVLRRQFPLTVLVSMRCMNSMKEPYRT